MARRVIPSVQRAQLAVVATSAKSPDAPARSRPKAAEGGGPKGPALSAPAHPTTLQKTQRLSLTPLTVARNDMVREQSCVRRSRTCWQTMPKQSTTGALERWPAFFTEDGEYQIITRESYDADLPIGILDRNGRAMMQDRVTRCAPPTSTSRTPIAICSGGPASTARATASPCASNFCVFRIAQAGDTVTFATGRYLRIEIVR